MCLDLMDAVNASNGIEGTFEYEPQHRLKNESELLALLDKHPEGMLLGELKDAYREVLADVKVRCNPKPLTLE